MPTINIKIKGLDRLQAGFRKAPRLIHKQLNIAIDKSIQEIDRNLAVDWKAGGYGIPVLTGLLRSTRTQKLGDLRGEIGTTRKYGVYVHEGTSRMRARPYLEKSAEKAMTKINKHFDTAIDKVLRAI